MFYKLEKNGQQIFTHQNSEVISNYSQKVASILSDFYIFKGNGFFFGNVSTYLEVISWCAYAP